LPQVTSQLLTFDLATLCGLPQVQPGDVLRVRALSLSVGGVAGVGYFSPRAVAGVGPNGAGVPINTAFRRFSLEGAVTTLSNYQGGNQSQDYELSAPIDVLGSDFQTQAWTPGLYIWLWLTGLSASSSYFSYSIFGLFDLYQGANQ
jgi:hypothetical protein